MRRECIGVDIDGNALGGRWSGVAGAVVYAGGNEDDITGIQPDIGAVDNVEAVSGSKVIIFQYGMRVLIGHVEGWRSCLRFDVEVHGRHSLFIKGPVSLLQRIRVDVHKLTSLN